MVVFPRPLSCAAIAAACLVMVGAGSAQPARAEAGDAVAVTCGAVLTTDARLDRDLSCPEDGGLVIRGDLTLDLDGHRLTGPSVGTTIGTGRGVTVDGAWDVTVADGEIAGWSIGTLAWTLDGGDSSVNVQDVDFRNNGTGFDAVDGPRVQVTGSTFEGNGTGIHAFRSEYTVDRSRFHGNAVAVSIGSGGLWMTSSQITDSELGVDCSDGACSLDRTLLRDNGTALRSWLSAGLVARSTFVGNEVGAHMMFHADAVIERSTFLDNGVGVLSAHEDWSIVRRTLFLRNGTGIRSESDEGGDVPAFPTYEGNTLVRNGTAST